MYSWIIKNVNLIDGTGSKAVLSDIAIEQDKIVAVGNNIGASSAKNIVDGKGLTLTPGFIDVQNHSDSYWQIFDNPGLESIITQGYTTLLLGNSGSSLAPLISPESLRSVQKWKPTTGLNVNWQTFWEYKQQLQQLHFSANLLSLVGYSTVRRGLLGDSMQAPDNAELESILSLIEQSLQEGASGVSLGLFYSHEINVTDVEIIALAELCAKHNKLLSVALRNESDKIVDSVQNLVAIAEQTGVKLKIAHLKVRYQANWPLLKDVLDIIEAAWHKGTKVYFDSYPYTYTLQPLYTYLPSWSLVGGRGHLLDKISDPELKTKIISELRNHPTKLSALTVASTNNNLKVNGRTISVIASDMQVTSEEAILNLISNGGVSTLVFDECLDEQSVNILNDHSLGMIATNGGGYDLEHGSQLVHPRSFGTSSKFLRRIIDGQTISLEEAIAKLTSRPAELLGLSNRGIIKTGNIADLVLFDPAKINSKATIQNPYQYSEGIESVWVAGELAVNKGRFIETMAGKFIE
jgi:N-acyl-D-aspartate/D-glutamate deacylase